MILRTAETFGFAVTVYDPHGLFADDRLQTIADFACGALGRRPPVMIKPDVIEDWRTNGEGRLIATTTIPSADKACDFKWQSGDRVLLGNEYDGLPSEVTKACDARVHVEVRDRPLPKPRSASPIDAARAAKGFDPMAPPSLNVSATAAILAFLRYKAHHRG